MQLMHASHEMKSEKHTMRSVTVYTVTRDARACRIACRVAASKRLARSDPGSGPAAAALLSCPTLLRPVLVLSRIGDKEIGLTRPALGADYYLTSLTSVKHRED